LVLPAYLLEHQLDPLVADQLQASVSDMQLLKLIIISGLISDSNSGLTFKQLNGLLNLTFC